MRADAGLGFTLRPGLDLQFPSEGRQIAIKTVRLGVDDIGYRDIGTRAPFDAIAVGDSFTFCDDAPAEACWVRLLSDHTALSIATLGVNGYSNLAEAGMLAEVADELRPKLVLVGFFPNDFKDNLHFRNWTKSGSDDYWTWMRRKRRSDLSEFLAEHSVLYRLFDAARRYGKRDTFEYRKDGLAFTFRADAWWRSVVDDPGETPGFVLMRDAFRDMKKQTDAMGASLMVLLFPFKEQVYWHIAEQYQPEDAQYTQEQIDAPLQAVESFCETEGIDCCDLTGPLRERAESGPQLYLRVGAHWSDAGNRAAAEIVEDCLAKRGMLEGAGFAPQM